MTQNPSQHLHVACIRCRAPLPAGQSSCTRCANRRAVQLRPSEAVEPVDPFDAHLKAERKRKITVVLSVLAGLWYLLLLAKPIFAQRPDVGLCFVSIAPIAIGIWLWSKPVSRIHGQTEVRLEAADIQSMLLNGMSRPEVDQSFNIRVVREPDYLSCEYQHRNPAAKGTLSFDLSESEEFTKLAWALHFDGRVTSDNAHFIQHHITEWLTSGLTHWLI
jgi:hypothetical protein